MSTSVRRRIIRSGIPWCITIVALYIVFRGVDWEAFRAHVANAHRPLILLAVVLTSLSYALRARRWQTLFPRPSISYLNSAQVLILGFFMNNVLPARTGELVRAHLGAKVTREPRTLVLATIASERLTDGLALSLFFVMFSMGLGDQGYSTNLFYVACAFALACIGVLLVLTGRNLIFRLVEEAARKRDTKLTNYLAHRAQVFITGLSPLCAFPNFLIIAAWSVVIWTVELMVYVSIAEAYDQQLPWGLAVLFMVAVNFSSLIPAAPGGIGVIEAATTAVLVSVGIERERALTMVLTQHVIQYLVIGVPGLLALMTWRKSVQLAVEASEGDDVEPRDAQPTFSRNTHEPV